MMSYPCSSALNEPAAFKQWLLTDFGLLSFCALIAVLGIAQKQTDKHVFNPNLCKRNYVHRP